MRMILEGGESDTERLDLELDEPPDHWIARGERYEPVLDYYDRPMRDISGRWRFRLKVPFLKMPHGYDAPRIKP